MTSGRALRRPPRHVDVYTRADLPYAFGEIRARLEVGQVAILPTDTVYGLSANGLDETCVAAVLRIKRKDKPLSLVPHSVDWARLVVAERHHRLFDETLEAFAGPYTTFWRRAPGPAPAAIRSSPLIGFRLPSHWIAELAAQVGFPLMSTSANRSGAPYMTCLDDLDPAVREGVDFIVYEGPLPGPPSTLVRCQASPFRFEERT